MAHPRDVKGEWDWTVDAICAQMAPEDYFIAPGTPYNDYVVETCKFACPVREQCLERAMMSEGVTTKKRYGLWGGLLPSQRTRLFKAMREKYYGDQSSSDHDPEQELSYREIRKRSQSALTEYRLLFGDRLRK